MQSASIRSLIARLSRPGPTIAPVPHRSLIYVYGAHSAEFLNGLLSTMVSPHPFFTAFISAQGRVMHDAFVFTKGDDKGQLGYIVDYDSRNLDGPPLLEMLKRHILRSKVRVQDVSDEYDVWSAWTPESVPDWESERSWNIAKSGVIEPVWPESQPWPWGKENLAIRDRRAVGMGERLLVPKSKYPLQKSTHDTAASDAYTLHRMLHGVPEGSVDIPPLQALPMESNLDVMGGCELFSQLKKGCYVGQELTVRTYHTGMIRKRILPIELEQPFSLLKTHSDIKVSYNDEQLGSGLRPRLRGTGKLLSNIGDLGLAMLRLEHVDLADRNLVKFHVERESDDNNSCRILHFWPRWWPRNINDGKTSI